MLCLPHWVAHFTIGLALALGRPDTAPVTTRPGGMSSEAEPVPAERLLQEARDLEQDGQWAEALRRYEDVHRCLPGSPGPDEGAERCRCHLRVEARCRSAATRDFAQRLTASRGVALYEEFLERISASYVEEVPLAPLVGRGMQNCVLAAQTPEFARTYGLRDGTEPAERWTARMAALKRGVLGAVLTPAEGADLLQQVLRANVETVAAADGAFAVEMIQGAVEGLDAYSAFLNPERLAALRTEIDGEFVGLGIRIALKDATVVVVEPIEGSPAAAAGVRAGDRLLAVDGHGTEGLTLEEVARLLHGPVHGPVVVAVRHAGEAAPVALTICRERIVLKSVTRVHRIVAPPPSGANESHPGAGVPHSVKIAFAVDRETDVAVSVENARGEIVRHLVAGVLGKNPPEPLKANSLAQSIMWDGLDDDGKAASGGPFRIRVGLGL
jgi:hypothetical protein